MKYNIKIPLKKDKRSELVRFRQNVLVSDANNHTDNKVIHAGKNLLFPKTSQFLPISNIFQSLLVFQKIKLDAGKENCKA